MTSQSSMSRVVSLSFAVLLLVLAPAVGQTNQEVNGGIQFNFSNPGARSLALGGAILAVADDATAAVSNPAGLTNLSRPEISAEVRRWNYQTEYLDGGGPPPSFTFKRSDDTVTSLSFGSFVYPGRNWAVAAYYHEQAHFLTRIRTQGTFLGVFLDAGTPNAFFRRPIDGRAELKIANYGVSGSVRLGETLSLGAGVAASQYTQETTDTRFDVCTSDDVHFSRCPSPSSFDSSTGEQTKVAYSAGLLWKPSRLVSFGAVYRHGPKFDRSKYSVTNPDGSILAGSIPCPAPSGTTFGNCAVLKVPDTFGAGLALRPTDLLTVSVDYDRVRYSQLTDRFTAIQADESADFGSHYTAEDADEFHLGVQYSIPVQTSVVALRVGVWRDPAHGVRFKYDSTGLDEASRAFFATEQAAFNGGKTETHYSGGLGVAIGPHVQVDLGYDSAPSVRTGSASLVVRF